MSHQSRKPLWRRTASAGRRSIYRVATVVDRVVRWRHRDNLPPAHLRLYYYGTWDPDRFAQACQSARTELMIRGLRPEHRILDIGCGIGNLPLALIGYLTGTYDGVDVHPEAIAWCRRAIGRRHPSFRFHRANVASSAYNPRGQKPASAYRFPFPDRSFDVVYLASVFTHMLPDEVEQYVSEIARVLAPGGLLIESYFLLNDETRAGVEAGRSFLSFPVAHESAVCLLHDAAVPEAAVAIDEAWVRRLHERAGLRIRDIRRGKWWDGTAHDQDVLTVELDA